jgi:hypothetical protein
MAVTANQIVKRQGGDGHIRSCPVAASTHLYGGTLAYLDTDGNATGAISNEDLRFIGIVREEIDNSAGAAAAKSVELWTDGDFDLPMASASLLQSDVNITLYGVDNFTLSETAANQPEVGKLVALVSTSVARVRIRGLGEGLVVAGT